MRELLALREREGLTLRELSAVSEVPVGTLAWWGSELRRRDRLVTRDEAPEFVEVVLPAVIDGETHAAAEPDWFEIDMGAGRCIRVPQSYGLERLVRELRAC